MTAVDFAAFVERLAQVSSDVILPFFRSAIGAEDKSRGGAFRRGSEQQKKEAARRRPESREETPKEGMCGSAAQVLIWRQTQQMQELNRTLSQRGERCDVFATARRRAILRR